MGTALTDQDALNCSTTHGTRLARPIINSEVILEVAAAIDPIDAGSVPPDPFLKHRTDGFPERFSLLAAEGVGRLERVKPGTMKSFIGIDVAKPGEERLVQQERFEQPPSAPKRGIQPARGEVIAQGFGAKPAQDGFGAGRIPDAAKLARIVEDQDGILRRPRRRE
jgi:hypothetical protein